MTRRARRLVAWIAVCAACLELGGALLFGSSSLRASAPRAFRSVVAVIRASPPFREDPHPYLPPFRLCAESFAAWPSADVQRANSLLASLTSSLAPTPSDQGPVHPEGSTKFVQVCQSSRSLLAVGYIDTSFSAMGAGMEFRSYFLWLGVKWVHLRTYRTVIS